MSSPPPQEPEKKTQVVNIIHGAHFDTYVGRPGLGFSGEFGNPFRIGRHGTRDETIQKFRRYFYNRLEKEPEFGRKVRELKGLKLGCFCSPRACHADVIASYLNNLCR